MLPQNLTPPKADPELKPSAFPASDATFAETLAYVLQTKILTVAHAPGTTTGECLPATDVPDSESHLCGSVAILVLGRHLNISHGDTAAHVEYAPLRRFAWDVCASAVEPRLSRVQRALPEVTDMQRDRVDRRNESPGQRTTS